MISAQKGPQKVYPLAHEDTVLNFILAGIFE